MKKILLVLSVVFGLALVANARDNFSRDASTLPTAARETIKKNFKADISLIKTEKTLGRVSEYEVILNDGSEVTFDAKGNWKDIEAPAGKNVPDAMVPADALKYVKANHKNTKIVSIEREKGGYDIELSNGVDLKFDLNGKFLRYD